MWLVLFTVAHVRFSHNTLPFLIIGGTGVDNSRGGLIKFEKKKKKGEVFFNQILIKTKNDKVNCLSPTIRQGQYMHLVFKVSLKI